MSGFDPAFGDDDPEDGYDRSDSLLERLRNFALRVAWLADHPVIAAELSERLERLRADLETLRRDIGGEP